MNLDQFKELWLSEATLEALRAKWFEVPTEIQVKTIPLLLAWTKDIIGQAQTWTWKTAAFWLPLIEKINEEDKWVQAIILTPTRELAIQVTEEINSFKWNKKLHLATIYWWQSYTNELYKLKRWMHIIVWTPWRVMDHLRKWTLDIRSIKYFVLDEADEMLNMGFKEDIETILKTTPKEKKMLLFSATMPRAILEIAKRFMWDYEIVTTKKNQGIEQLIEQIYFQVSRNDKFDALCRIVDMEDNFLWIVFCRTKNDVDEITIKLQNRWYDVDWIHWDVKQSTREKIIARLKNWKIKLLIATDVAARWIDINNLTHVINYSLPEASEGYTHRIWRTWRAWKTWVAITFVTASEHRRLFYIQKDTNSDIKKEKLPTINDVVKRKKDRLIENIINTLDTENLAWMQDIATNLLADKDPQNVVAAILKHYCKNEFEISSYRETEDNDGRDGREAYIDNKWITRLFFAKGKNDQMTPGKIIEIVTGMIKIDSNKIKNIWIYDSFSFLNMPFADAENLLYEIKKMSKWGLPLITKAKNKEWGWRSWGWKFNRGRSRWPWRRR